MPEIEEETEAWCPICGKLKPKIVFRYGIGGLYESVVCNPCAGKMDKRLDAFVEFDKTICKELGLDYWNVSNYEKQLREKGFYRKDMSFRGDHELEKKRAEGE